MSRVLTTLISALFLLTSSTALAGGLSPKDVKKVIQDNQSALSACSTPSSKGQVKAKFTIAPDGKVKKVSLTGGEDLDSAVKRCVGKALHKLTFPASDEEVSISYPIAIKPAAAGPDAHGLSGTWQSEWGEVTVEVSGDTVTGAWAGGSFKGTFQENGRVIDYTWEQPDGTSGVGYFEIITDAEQNADNGRKLQGTWGFGSSPNNGGAWTLYGQKKADPKK